MTARSTATLADRSNTHVLTGYEVERGRIGISMFDSFWYQFGAFDLVTEWGTAYGRTVRKHPHNTCTLWLGRTVTSRLAAGMRVFFTKVDDATVRLEVVLGRTGQAGPTTTQPNQPGKRRP